MFSYLDFNIKTHDFNFFKNVFKFTQTMFSTYAVINVKISPVLFSFFT